MEAKGARQRWSYAEFARLPSEGSTRHEVIDGEVCVTPSPTSHHQKIVTRLVATLHPLVEAHGLGEVYAGPLDVLFAPGDYLEPDLLFLSDARSELLTERGVEGPPDLVVEVTSPSTAGRDRGVKLERYRLYGVREYWIVDPDERTVEVWDLEGSAPAPTLLGVRETLRWKPSEGAPTLEIPLSELFKERPATR